MQSHRSIPIEEKLGVEMYDPEIVIVNGELHLLLIKPGDVTKDCYISKKWLTRLLALTRILERLESTEGATSAKAN